MSRPVPGERLLHPAVLACIFVLILNDHWLKADFPSWWTGKLSDFAGLAFFPVLLQAVVEWTQQSRSRFSEHSERLLASCVVATGLAFTALNVFPSAEALYESGLGFLQWAVALPGSLLAGSGWVEPGRVSATQDNSDLLALPALLLGPLIAGWIGRSRARP